MAMACVALPLLGLGYVRNRRRNAYSRHFVRFGTGRSDPSSNRTQDFRVMPLLSPFARRVTLKPIISSAANRATPGSVPPPPSKLSSNEIKKAECEGPARSHGRRDRARGGGVSLYEVQTRRNASKLLAQADIAEKQKNVSRAATILDRYLRYRPEDTDALARYGLLQADHALAAPGASGQADQAALLVLEQVLGRDEDRDDVRRRAIDLSLRLRRFPNAKVHVDVLKPKHPEDAELEQAIGRCAEANGEIKDAIAFIRRRSSTIRHRSTPMSC